MLLDGEEMMPHVTEFDTDAGYVEVNRTNEYGHSFIENGEIARAVWWGNVEVTMREEPCASNGAIPTRDTSTA